MNAKLDSRDYRFILICVLVCAASLFVGIRYFYRAFPEASIDFKVTRDTSLPLAQKFLADQEISTSGYRHASVFRYDDEAKVFLEREIGLERANALMEREVRLWRWAHRWFKPLQKEELRVEVTTRGEIASFYRSLPEDSPGANLTALQARGMAESFLVLQMNRDIDSLEFLDSQTEKRPKRTDHVFTWKVAGMNYRDATYRVSVTIHGDRVDGYSEFLKIPEEWSRGYARLRSLNESTTQVDLLFFALLGVGMLVTFGRRVRMKDIQWKTALVFAAISFVLQFLGSLNLFPLSEYNFDTTGSYGSFVGRTLLSAVLGSLTLGGIILLLTACSEPLYRQSYAAHLSISRMFSWNAIRTRGFFIASLAGITLTFFFFAYEIGFYLTAKKFGAWAPAELPYTDLLNTRFPWIFVLLGGFFPAVSEEWMFRAFSIPYLQTLLRHRWIAILLASFIWGFGHANYPNQPFFIRGIEVGIVGLILSWAMLRFGILAPLIAHYSIDAFYTAFLFLRSGNLYLVTTGAITAGINLIPLLVAAGAYFATRTFRSEAQVINANEATAPPILEEPARTEPLTLPSYMPLQRRIVYAGLSLLVLGKLLLIFQPPRFGDFIRFRVSASQAEDSAVQFLSNLGFDLQAFRRVTLPINRTTDSRASRMDRTAPQYIYTAGGVSKLNQIYNDLVPAAVWQTRLYKPLEKEEFWANVDPATGKVRSFLHSLGEDTPGADLPQDQAREITTSFLRSQNYDLPEYELKETKSEKPKVRRDTEFTWEARDGTAGAVAGARMRVQAGILGNKIGKWTQFVKIPEDWLRTRERQNFYSISVLTVRILFIVALFALAASVVVRQTRLGIVKWKLAAKIAAVVVSLELVNVINSVRELLFQYDTRMDMRVFILSMSVGMIIDIIGIALAIALAVGLILACYPDAPGVLRSECRTIWAFDAGVAGLTAMGASMILQVIAANIHYRASDLALAPTISLPPNLEAYFPAASVFRDAVLMSLFYSTALAFGIYLWTKIIIRKWQRIVLLAALLGSFLPTSARRLSEVAFDSIGSLLLIGLACWIVAVFFRDNYLAYAIAPVILALSRAALSLDGQGDFSLQTQAWLLWAVIVGAIAFLILARRGSPEADAPT